MYVQGVTLNFTFTISATVFPATIDARLTDPDGIINIQAGSLGAPDPETGERDFTFSYVMSKAGLWEVVLRDTASNPDVQLAKKLVNVVTSDNQYSTRVVLET